MSIKDTPIGVTLTYKPHGAFLPVDREFPWATPDDLVFVLAAFQARQGRGRVTRAEIVEALHEARMSQMEWHEDHMRTALLTGLGWWAKLVPSRLIDRVIELAMNHYYESTSQWAVEMADLYEQVNSLNSRMSDVGRAQTQQARIRRAAPSYGPMIHCGGGCDKAILLEHLASPPPGWTVSEEKVPFCPEHSGADVVTSQVVSS
jgi:hypothetical protein